MDTFIDGALVGVSSLVTDYLPAPTPLDGEVTSVDEMKAIVEDAANAGKSYYMRGGTYGELNWVNGLQRPTSLITFITYPGEQVIFSDVFFGDCQNLRFDGNPANTFRAHTGAREEGVRRHPNDQFGLWFRGSGLNGDTIPPVGAAMVIAISSGSATNENLQFANFRLGDEVSADQANWKRQHGIAFGPFGYDILMEDFQLAYVGNDLTDQEPGGPGDAEAGGYGIWFVGTDPFWGNFTLRRGHFSHTMNDFVQYAAKASTPPAEVIFEDCLFEELYNYGGGHADMLQVFGGTQKVTFEGCVWRRGSDYLLHGNNPGETRLFHNCLFGDPVSSGTGPNLHQIVASKDDESGPDDWEWRDCTITNLQIEAIRTDGTGGAPYTSNNVISNCIYSGCGSGSGLVMDNVYTDDGLPNINTGSSGLSSDVPGVPVYNADGECTNFTQGYRRSATFPWDLS